MSSPDLTFAATLAADGASAGNGVRAAIARASQATGVDFTYLLAQARLESSLNPSARASGSSAAGLYQFTNGTWLQTLQKHGNALAGGLAGSEGTGPSVLAALSNPAARAQLMALRYDPNASAMMAAQLAGDNQQALTSALGRSPDASELYLAHFLGSDGAVKFLTAMAADPTQSAAALLPKAAAANHAVFFDSNGTPRSLGAMMGLLRGRLAVAMQDSGGGLDAMGVDSMSSWAAMDNGSAVDPSASVAAPAYGGPIAQEFAAARDVDFAAAQGGAVTTSSSSTAPAASAAPLASMADTLRGAFENFADATGSSPPAAVRAAYGRMQALGL